MRSILVAPSSATARDSDPEQQALRARGLGRTLANTRGRLMCVLAVLAVGPALASGDEVASLEQFYRQRIEPVLVKHCFECHSGAAEALEASLRLDGRSAMVAGGDTGPAVVPGDPGASLLVQALRYQDLEMPPAGRLPESVIADFERWIAAGAKVPADRQTSADIREPDYTEARAFWSFRPLQEAPLPLVENRAWPRTPIDYFVLHQLERRGLGPSAPAARHTLIRRVYFDVLGLPPTPQQVEQFVQDPSADAYERLIDRLLASPQYGERGAQHWLDVVRFAESEGFEYDRKLPGAWRFRDYVIDSLNADKPYDQFVTEQLAGDELNPADPTYRVAAGFHRLGAVRRNAGNQKVASSRNEVLTERTDIVGAAFLGLTVGCARCHDHKFDPIPQRDYYRLQAYFAASREDNVVLASEAEQRRWKTQTTRIQSEIDELKKVLKKQTGSQELATRQRIAALELKLPSPLPTLCSIKNDAKQASPVHLLKRGDPNLPGPRVEPRPLGIVLPAGTRGGLSDEDMPRSRLAAWVTAVENPLTPRVLVNRLWQQHFGRGLVATANDFGENGDRPSHPQLLDYLAHRLIANDWQTKALHRMLLLSSTYRQASTIRPGRPLEIDPENRFLWHFSRRRLSSEEIRDALLTVSGMLNDRSGGESVMVSVDEELIDQLYKPSQWQVTENQAEHYRRSVYLLAKRNLRLPFLEVFDQPAAQTSCAAREQSTHAPQALELLNGALSNELAKRLARRLRREAGNDIEVQVVRGFQLTTGRDPTDLERRLATQFIEEVSLEEFTLGLFNLNAFLYVD